MKNIITKKQYKDKKNLGGMIGTGVGAIGGSIIPGVGTAFGAQIGGTLGGLADDALSDNSPAVRTDVYGYDQGFTYAGGGWVPNMAFGGKMQYQDGGKPPKSGPSWGEKGFAKPIGQDAVKAEGPSHENGGIDIGNNTEIEGGETIDNIDGGNYVFSKRLKVPGTYKTFAKAHEDMVKRGASEIAIKRLAQIQENVAGR